VVDITLDVMHCSMQFSDSTKAKQADAKKIFERVSSKNKAWVSGTEAGLGASADLRRALESQAKANNYRFKAQSDVWIAVDRDRITPKTWKTGWIKTLESGTGSQNFSDRGILWAQWEDKELKAQVSVGVSHYMTHGRTPKEEYYSANTRLTRAIAAWGKQHGEGAQLCFFAADANIPDRTMDVFRGAPFTTLGDELKKWENTGHGTIDIIASYDADGRVKGKYWRVLDDREFPLATDHYAVEGGFVVRSRGTG
jgi:hypothetical protein